MINKGKYLGRKYLIKTDKEILSVHEEEGSYVLESEIDREGNEEAIIRISGNIKEEVLEKILEKVFGIKRGNYEKFVS